MSENNYIMIYMRIQYPYPTLPYPMAMVEVVHAYSGTKLLLAVGIHNTERHHLRLENRGRLSPI